MFSADFNRTQFSKLLQSKLRILRAAANLSQSEVAVSLGLVRSTYVNYENGVKEIPWEKCLAMLFYFESIPGSREMIFNLKLLPENMRNLHYDE